MDTTPGSDEAPLLEMIRGALDAKMDTGDAVALKALHTKALALSKQRRALRRKAAAAAAAQPAGRVSGHNASLVRVVSVPEESRTVMQGTPEISLAEVRDSQQEFYMEAVQDVSADSVEAGRLSTQSQSSWPTFSGSRDPQDFKASFEAEALALGRAHRSMCSRSKATRAKPRGAAAEAALSISPAKEQTVEASIEELTPAPTINVNVCSVCGQTCPVCGGPDPLKSSLASGSHEEQVLAARLEMAETLLARAAPEAARAVTLEKELAAERAHSADLAEALRGTRSLACALHDGLEETTRQLELFMAKVRLAAEAASDTMCEVKGAADVLLQMDMTPIPVDQQALVASLHRDDGRVHELMSSVQRLHSELTAEKENVNEHRRAKRASTAELSLQQQLQLEAVAAANELQEQLREENAETRRYRRQSSVLDLNVRKSEAELAAMYDQMHENRAELQQCRAEERESEACARRGQHELRHTREELTASAQELIAVSGVVENLRLGIRHHNRRAGVLQAAVANEVQDAVAALHRECTLQMLSELNARSRLPWRSGRPSNARQHWQTVTVRVGTEPFPILHWKLQARSHFSRTKMGSFNLRDVVSVEYGNLEGLSARPREKPWNCFALRSANLTHFFWSSDDAVAETFVVGLSRLCPRTSPVRGRDFRLRRTVIRVGETRQARARALLAAVHRAAPEPAPEIYVSNPDGAVQVISPVSFSASAQAASSSAVHQVADSSGEAFSPVSFAGPAQPANSSASQQQDEFGSGTAHFGFASAVDAINRSRGEEDADVASAGDADDLEEQEDEDEEEEEEEGEEEPGDQWYETSQSSTRPGSSRSSRSDEQRGVSGASASATE